MGGLIMSNVFADHLRCPVVSLKHLHLFFELDGPPALETMEVGFREDYLLIQGFVRHCFATVRFCPAEDGPYCPNSNISCYITSDGGPDLAPINPKHSLFRLVPGKDKDESQDISHKVALRIASQYGEALSGQCHMGPEVSTYRLALVHLMERFAPDFRGLISPKMFCSPKHLSCLRLEREAPGMPDYADSAPPVFARQCCIRMREQMQAQAIGVNIWSLLTVTSLIGSKDLHPDISNCFSNSLLEAILAHAPVGSTPGRILPTPRFDHATNTTKLFISDENRPRHFLRPPEPSFVLNGVLPIAKASGRFAPEDVLHCAQLEAVAKNLHCDIMEVPANSFTVLHSCTPLLGLF